MGFEGGWRFLSRGFYELRYGGEKRGRASLGSLAAHGLADETSACPGGGTLGTLGRVFTILPFAGFGVPGGEAFLDFFGGDVFDVGTDGPAEAEGVED